MLTTTKKFKMVFEIYKSLDSVFKIDLGETRVPNFLNWECVRKIKTYWEILWTLHVSSSKYITSNVFFNENNDLCFILKEWKNS